MIKIQNGRLAAILFFGLIRSQALVFLRINLILGIWVYDHKILNKFENRYDPIQNGHLAAILVTLETTLLLLREFFSNHFAILHRDSV